LLINTVKKTTGFKQGPMLKLDYYYIIYMYIQTSSLELILLTTIQFSLSEMIDSVKIKCINLNVVLFNIFSVCMHYAFRVLDAYTQIERSKLFRFDLIKLF